MKNSFSVLIPIAAGILAAACSHTPPGELKQAQVGYEGAKTGIAAAQAPAELFEAKKSLDKAERIFADDGNTAEVRHYAYMADRQIRIAQAVAQQRIAKTAAEESVTREREVVGEIAVQKTKEADSAEKRAAREREARVQAEREAASYREELSRIAKVAEEERGLVITMQGGILFPTGKASLLPGAADKLNQIARILKKSPNRRIVVEGHTDSAGPDGSNMTLSRERAEAVYSYLLSQGVPSDRIRAVGLGEQRPIASNGNTTGRAENRRVEIVLEGAPTLLGEDAP